MNRLTERTSDGIAYTKIPLNESHLNKREVIEQCFTGFVADRLAEYEDSGLSPEEVQELAKAKADGRLIVLPCKRGDVVYRLCGRRGQKWVGERLASGVSIYGNVIVVHSTTEDVLGKTVFLTREEAEKALGGGQE